MTEESAGSRLRSPRLSVAALMEIGRISETAEALDKHRRRVIYALGAAMVARMFAAIAAGRAVAASAPDAVPVGGVAIPLLVYSAVLWFMALRGRDRFAFGIALGIAVIEATSQAVGLVRGGAVPAGVAWTALVIATHLLLALVAFQASRDFPSVSSSAPWVKGFVVAMLFTLGVPTLRARIMQTAGAPMRVLSRPRVPSTGLAASLEMVTRCAREYQRAHPARGYPRRLSEMGRGGIGCITDSLVEQGEGRGWMFTYVPGGREANGRIGSYSVMARQSASPGQGVGFFETDETGIIRASRPSKR